MDKAIYPSVRRTLTGQHGALVIVSDAEFAVHVKTDEIRIRQHPL